MRSETAMTLSQLFQLVSEYPAHLRIVVEGHDGGFDDPEIRMVRIVEDENLEMGVTNMGRHGECVAPLSAGERAILIGAVPW